MSLRRLAREAGLVAVYPLRQAAAQQRLDVESTQPRPSAMHVLAARPAAMRALPGQPIARVVPLAPKVAVTQFGERLPEHAGAA